MSKTTDLKSALAVVALALAGLASAQWQLYDSTPCGTVVTVTKPLISDYNINRRYTHGVASGYLPVVVYVKDVRTDQRWAPGWQNMTGLSWYSCLTAVIPASDTADKTGATDDKSSTQSHNFDAWFDNESFDGTSGWAWFQVGDSSHNGDLDWSAVYNDDTACQRFKPGPPPNPAPYNYTRSKDKEAFKEYSLHATYASGLGPS